MSRCRGLSARAVHRLLLRPPARLPAPPPRPRLPRRAWLFPLSRPLPSLRGPEVVLSSVPSEGPRGCANAGAAGSPAGLARSSRTTWRSKGRSASFSSPARTWGTSFLEYMRFLPSFFLPSFVQPLTSCGLTPPAAEVNRRSCGRHASRTSLRRSVVTSYVPLHASRYYPSSRCFPFL
jgi:hypothetical protein